MLLMWYISFVNVIKKLIFWAGKGVKHREEEWMNFAKVVWSEVAVLCGFLDGSCERRVCGAGMLIKPSRQLLEWVTIHKKWRTGAQSEFLRRRSGRLCHADD